MYEFLSRMLGGAVGAGLALVFLPSLAVFFGAGWLSKAPIVGLPLLAMFGIMILFGALSLVASLFSKLNLTDKTQALALPEGSIRAAIALSLIVLFAIIAILLNQSASQPYVISGLTKDNKEVFVRDNVQRVIAVVPVCPTTTTKDGQIARVTSCDPNVLVYDVHVSNPPSQEYADLSKQLLILIGTLVTSVVSFYFGSRTSEVRSADAKMARSSDTNEAEEVDHDHGNITNPTPDDQLPPARGGVAS